jgi:flagellar hook-associated protein 3 FlgL
MLKSVSTFALLSQRSANLRALEADFARTNEEVSSGRKSDVVSAIREDTPALMGLRAKYEENTSYLQSVSTFERRSEIMGVAFLNVESALNGIVEHAIVNVPDAGDSIGTLSLSANAAIEQIVDALNANFDGRFLFSGVNIETAPLHRANQPSAISGLSPNQVIAAILDGTAYAPAQPPAFTLYTAAEAATAITRFTEVFDGVNAGLGPPVDDYSFERSFYNGAIGGALPSIRFNDGAPLSMAPLATTLHSGTRCKGSICLPASI